ncbi:MAG TPA: ABC-2 transporter permease [Clostridiaceae bacterium]|nr:ABC-2 transporter permease [Clostridiaceae bacterium]
MFRLVLKDIVIQKRTFIFALLYIPIMAIAFQNTVGSMLPAGVIGMIYVLLITACASDDKYNADVMLNSLPIQRKNIVLSKYISVLVYYIIGIAVYLIFSSIVKFLGLPFKLEAIDLADLLLTMFVVFLIYGTYLPVFYKFGYMKSRAVAFILFFGGFFFIGAVIQFIQKNLDIGVLKEIEVLFGEGGTAGVLVIFLVIVLMFAGSYLLSVKLYNNRDL